MRSIELPNIIVIGASYWFALTALAVFIYGWFVGFVTSGSLDFMSNAAFRNETVLVFGAGIGAVMFMEFANIWVRRRSFLQRPIVFITIAIFFVSLITVIQIFFPNQSSFYFFIKSGLETDNLVLALFADLTAVLMAVGAAGILFLWSFWHVVNPRFSLIDVDSQHGDLDNTPE